MLYNLTLEENNWKNWMNHIFVGEGRGDILKYFLFWIYTNTAHFFIYTHLFNHTDIYAYIYLLLRVCHIIIYVHVELQTCVI